MGMYSIEEDVMLEQFKEQYSKEDVSFNDLPDPRNKREFEVMEKRFKNDYPQFYNRKTTQKDLEEYFERWKKYNNDRAKKEGISYKEASRRTLADARNTDHAKAKKKFNIAELKFRGRCTV